MTFILPSPPIDPDNKVFGHFEEGRFTTVFLKPNSRSPIEYKWKDSQVIPIGSVFHFPWQDKNTPFC